MRWKDFGGEICLILFTSLVFQVAFSNSQAKKLSIYLSTFERHIDAVEKPNLDKEVRLQQSTKDALFFLPKIV